MSICDWEIKQNAITPTEIELIKLLSNHYVDHMAYTGYGYIYMQTSLLLYNISHRHHIKSTLISHDCCGLKSKARRTNFLFKGFFSRFIFFNIWKVVGLSVVWLWLFLFLFKCSEGRLKCRFYLDYQLEGLINVNGDWNDSRFYFILFFFFCLEC